MKNKWLKSEKTHSGTLEAFSVLDNVLNKYHSIHAEKPKIYLVNEGCFDFLNRKISLHFRLEVCSKYTTNEIINDLGGVILGFRHINNISLSFVSLKGGKNIFHGPCMWGYSSKDNKSPVYVGLHL